VRVGLHEFGSAKIFSPVIFIWELVAKNKRGKYGQKQVNTIVHDFKELCYLLTRSQTEASKQTNQIQMDCDDCVSGSLGVSQVLPVFSPVLHPDSVPLLPPQVLTETQCHIECSLSGREWCLRPNLACLPCTY
jgi:hypothetical protein